MSEDRMEPDEFTWIEAVPVRPPRTKRLTFSEFEWSVESPREDGRARLSARFMINSTELVAILVEDTTPAQTGGTNRTNNTSPSRLRVGGRSYRLFIEPPATAS